MLWRNPRIMKGTNSVWSVMVSVLAILAVVWIIAFNIQDPTWRWSVAAIGTVLCLLSPGGLSCIYWLFSPQFRKQWKDYRRGGPLPGYSPGAPWEASQPQLGKSLQEYTDFYLSKNTILGSHSEDFQRKLKEQMYGSVREVFAADKPFLKCREKLAEYVAGFADWQVLCLKPDEKAQLEKNDVRAVAICIGRALPSYQRVRAKQ